MAAASGVRRKIGCPHVCGLLQIMSRYFTSTPSSWRRGPDPATPPPPVTRVATSHPAIRSLRVRRRAPAHPPTALDERAAEAERSVTALFAGSLGGMPLTHLARIVHPAPARVQGRSGACSGTWHYWWQAHYLDAIVDAGLRSLRTGDPAGADRHAAQGDRLLQTIRLRNRVRWVNDFYDDMAWLALASGRLEDLHDELGRTARRRRLRSAGRHLTAQLRSAHTDDLGGGLFWSRDRDFKNSPATGPAALHLARLGETDEARRLVDWLYARLWSPESGLVLDGIRLRGGEEVLVPDVWSYNQGTVLGRARDARRPREPRPRGRARRRGRRPADRRGRRRAGAADARRR